MIWTYLGVLAFGGFVGAALMKWTRERRVILLRPTLDSLLQAIEQDDRVDSQPRRLELAVMAARKVLGR